MLVVLLWRSIRHLGPHGGRRMSFATCVLVCGVWERSFGYAFVVHRFATFRVLKGAFACDVLADVRSSVLFHYSRK